MKYATKLNLNVPMPFLGKAKVVIGQHGYQKSGFAGPKLVRKYLPNKQVELVRSALPDEIKESLVGVNLTESRILAPHIHTEDEAVINFYIQTGGEKTVFWEGDVVSEESEVNDNGDKYINLKRDNLQEAEYFVAKPSDVWLINTRVPHSVGYINDNRSSDLHFEPLDDEKRLLVQAFFCMPYDQVANALKNRIAL
jgi:hypothetical protein